ncbi:MAG TPA: esterase-like activity of phytase family protein, partial [Nocardioides sp.]|nr:esterase-like activity of phytase family protein [Nocardioides sp.]
MPRLGRWVGLALATSTLVALGPAGHAGTAPHGSHPAHARKVVTPTLVARASISADHIEPGPPSGAQATPANGRTGPFPGQVIPGFSAVVEGEHGLFYAQPDNGFGTKQNSADFLLRIYKVKPRWETADGGPGRIDVKGFISLRDPDHKIDFPIVNGATNDRLLTGADFDVESLVRQPDGTFWVGDEFGPFLLHFGPTGKLLQKPVPFPDGMSPQNPYLQPGQATRIAASRGFEAMGGSADGKHLYPILEGAFTDDSDQRRRWIYEFDTRSGQYTGKRWAYQTDESTNFAGDAFTVRKGELLVDERDNFDGPAAVFKRIYRVDLNHTDAQGFVEKTLVVDLLKIANPAGIGRTTSPGAYGVSDPFSFPFVSVETVVELRDGNLLTANDNNYPGDDARYPGTPDDTEMVIIDPDAKTPAPTHSATVIGHRGSAGTRPEHTLASYEQAILGCADYIEPDVVTTKDGVLVARHEPEISGTTDVASHPEFAARKTTKLLDGVSVTGWFVEDFTLAELKTLRAVERLPAVRPQNTTFNGLYAIPTLDEVLDLARHSRTCDGGKVGVYPETKHPTYFKTMGLSTDQPLLDQLAANGMDHGYPVFIQSFETTNLKQLDAKTDVPLVQLVDCAGAPFDLRSQGDPTTYADLVTRDGLRKVSRYADGIGPCKDLLIPRDAQGRLLQPTSVIDDAHRSGLVVHPFTFR